MQPVDVEDTSAPALPCAGGLIAGTLALMTCWCAPEPTRHANAEQQRVLMARKIASNLFFLREHPDLAPGLRQVIGKLHERWLLLAQGSPCNAPPHAEPAATADALH